MNRRQVLLIAACSFAAPFVAGCGGPSRSSYIPAVSTARNALEITLETWKKGTPFGPIESNPTINVFEGRWRDGKKLESFEILEEIKNPDQPQFKVKLQLAGEPETTAIYHVIGKEPMNVFSDEAFKQAQSM
jgi:hypothetical protein